MMRSKACGHGFWLIVFTLLLTALPVDLHAADNQAARTIRAASEYDYPPFCTTTGNNEADGFSVELLRAALAEMGYDVSFKVGPWAEVKESLVAREIQVLPLVGRTPEREAVFDFTFPYMTMHGTIVVRADEDHIKSLDDLQGRRIAVMAGDNAEEFVRRQNLGASISTTPGFKEALLELSRGKHDAVIIQKLLYVQLLNELGIGNLKMVGLPLQDFKQSFCFAVAKGDLDLLGILNEGLSIVMADGTYQNLRKRWFAALDAPVKTRIVVGGDFNYPPYEYLDENGEPAGYNVELTSAIARHLDLQVHFELGPWEEIKRKLANQEIDIVQGMFYSPGRDKVFDFTDHHALVSHVAVVRAGTETPRSLADLAGKTIVVMRGDIMHDKALKAGFADNLILTQSQEEALQILSAGRGDCALIARLPAMYWIQKDDLSNLRVGEKSFSQAEYCYASYQGNQNLVERFSLALSNLKATGEYRGIHNKWLGIYQPQGLNSRVVIKYILIVTLPILLLLLVVFTWSYSLKKQVRLRTLDLEAEVVERKLAEQALRNSEAQQRAMVENILDVITIIGRDGIIRFTSPNIEKWLGWRPEERIGTSPWENIHPDDRDRTLKIFTDLSEKPGMTATGECRYRRKNGGYEWIEFSGVNRLQDKDIAGILISYHLITERKQAEAARQELKSQLRQAQRIESVGRLAGGVAHDYNNMLSVIIGNVELARMNIEQTAPLEDNLEQILQAAHRSRDITRQLLAFARKQIIDPKVIDLNTAIESILKMLRNLLGENINLSWQPKGNLWPVKVDPSQLDQILANLCINARDAIADVGKMIIETDAVSFDADYCKGHQGFPPGDYTMLAVSDNGCGMDRETLENIFEPFFTTKNLGEGTGLGLATVYGVVKQSGGFINVYSEPGQGTTFKIYFPRCVEKGVVEQEDTVNEVQMGQGETVMLVEDDAGIMKLAKTILEDLGYRVLATNSPEEAIALAEGHPGEIQLLLTDVVMPNMNGRDLAKRLKSINPAMKVFYMSGYTADIIANHGVLEGGINFIQKPFARGDLSIRIREILDANS